jgi:hypothetical protein
MDYQSDLDKCLEGITKKYVEEKVKDALEIILKLLNNILKNPKEQKIRMFKKTNDIIKSRILVMKEFLTLMTTIGYVNMDDECLMYPGDDFTNIKTAIDIINTFLSKVSTKVKEKDLLEIIKHNEEVKRYNDEINKKFRDEKEKQKKILDQFQHDKEERKKMEKPKDSISKKLNFGANVCKFEPTNTGGGGG